LGKTSSTAGELVQIWNHLDPLAHLANQIAAEGFNLQKNDVGPILKGGGLRNLGGKWHKLAFIKQHIFVPGLPVKIDAIQAEVQQRVQFEGNMTHHPVTEGLFLPAIEGDDGPGERDRKKQPHIQTDSSRAWISERTQTSYVLE